MKTFLVAMMAVMLGAAALFAGDEENVKALVLKDWQMAAEGKFTENLALRAPDYIEKTGSLTISYEQCKWLLTSLDGKHPMEFLLALVTIKLHGAKIPADTMAQIREVAHKPECIRYYEKAYLQLAAELKDNAAFELKTLKFISAKVDGNSATVVVEYKRKSSTIPVTQTVSLRRFGEAWKISKVVDGDD